MDVLMPQLGETVAEGKISKWFVAAGDAVKPGDNLFEIETDKVSMEVPAIAAGTLAAIHVQAGEVVPVGAVVAVIQSKGETVSTDKPTAPAKPAAPLIPAKAGIQKSEVLGPRFPPSLKLRRTETEPVEASAKTGRGDERTTAAAVAKPFTMEPFREVRTPEHNYGPARLPGGTVVTPLARRLAGEAGIDLAHVNGSGPRGRIVAADIGGAQKTRAMPAPAQAAANVVVTANIPIGHALVLLQDAKGDLSLADVIVKAWATALERIMAADSSGVALSIGKSQTTIRGATAKSLTAIAAARRDTPGDDGMSATSAILMTEASGIATITGVLRRPHITMLSIGSQRRVPVEAEDGAVRFVDVVTATLVCDEAAVDSARGTELLAAFDGYVANPVTMIV